MPVKTIYAALALGLGLVTAVAGDLEWKTDMNEALAQAKSQNKTVLIDITGSDWCGFCIRLDKEVFSTDAFKAYAKDNLVLVKADFPRKTPISNEQKQANEALRAKYAKQFRGYPTIVLVQADGKKAGEIVGYAPGTGPEKYIGKIKAELRGS